MSTYFYAVCETHKVYSYITDNKGNPPDRMVIRCFMSDHYPTDDTTFIDEKDACRLAIVSEHEISDNYKTLREYADPCEDEPEGISDLERMARDYRVKEES